MNKWRVLPMDVFGVKMFAVEQGNYTEKYCDTKQEAEQCCEELNQKESAK